MLVGAVGLFYVGAVLFLNGVLLLGRVDAKAAAVFNLFVGALQVITPTFLIFTAGGDPDIILNASGLYLFGFTYLYVGIGLLANLDSTGVGWFSLFVSLAALGYSFANFRLLDDTPFGVIWLYWSFLWFLFFLLFGLKLDGLTSYTGWVTAIEGFVTAAIPAFLILTGYWDDWRPGAVATVLAVIGVAMAVGLLPLTRPRLHAQPATPSRPGTPPRHP